MPPCFFRGVRMPFYCQPEVSPQAHPRRSSRHYSGYPATYNQKCGHITRNMHGTGVLNKLAESPHLT